MSYPCHGEREDDSIHLLERKISRTENKEGSRCGRGVVMSLSDVISNVAIGLGKPRGDS
jgi:hypothetical protein